MPILHEVAQYSEEYDRLKIGIPTSSYFHKIITPQGKPSKQWREYACVLIAERILQRLIGSSATKAYWKSRPPYRRLKSNTGFPARSMSASGLSCKVSSTFLN